MTWGVTVNDSGQAHASSGVDVGGITFGSAGSGRHTSAPAAKDAWQMGAAVLLVAIVALVVLRKKGKG